MFCNGIFRCLRVLLILWFFTSLAFAQAANASAGTGSAGESSCVSTIVSDASNPGCGPTESTPTTNPPKSAVILVNSNGDIGIGEELLELKLHSQILLLLLAILVGVFGGVIGLIVGMHTSKRSHQSQAVQAIATVNGVQIPVSRFLLHLRNAIAEGSNDTPELHQAILDDLIFSEAVAQDAERIEYTADRGLLSRLASLTSGKVLEPSELDTVFNRLGPASVSCTERHQVDIWDSWPWFIMILALLTAEWILRKKARLP